MLLPSLATTPTSHVSLLLSPSLRSPAPFPFAEHLLLALRTPSRPRRVLLHLSPASPLSASASARRRPQSGGATEPGWGSEDGEPDGDGLAMPFKEMERWLASKPRGFGEGKTYDTAVEEALLEEMERSRQAQTANLNRLKSNDIHLDRKQPSPSQKKLEVIPGCICVRVCNLPRKRNIHRDLQLAFKGFPGLININPVVTGNKKTRDPVCKGLAFLDLESEEAAARFVEMFSKRSVPFGKVQKQIICDIIDPHGVSEIPKQSSETPTSGHPEFVDIENGIFISSRDIGAQHPSASSSYGGLTGFARREESEEAPSLVDEQAGSSPDLVVIESGIEQSKVPISGVGRGAETSELELNDTMQSSLKQRRQVLSKKKRAKAASTNNSKLSVPGSVSRLKVKERTVLTGVFSKYGGKAAVTLSKAG